MLSKSLFLSVVLATASSVGDAFTPICPQQLKPSSRTISLLNAQYSSRPFATAVNNENDIRTQQELQKIMTMSVQAIENELRDTYGQVFCNNHFTPTHKEDLAVFLLQVRRTKQPISYEEMPIIGDGTPGSWINDKSGDFFRV